MTTTKPFTIGSYSVVPNEEGEYTILDERTPYDTGYGLREAKRVAIQLHLIHRTSELSLSKTREALRLIQSV